MIHHYRRAHPTTYVAAMKLLAEWGGESPWGVKYISNNMEYVQDSEETFFNHSPYLARAK